MKRGPCNSAEVMVQQGNSVTWLCAIVFFSKLILVFKPSLQLISFKCFDMSLRTARDFKNAGAITVSCISSDFGTSVFKNVSIYGSWFLARVTHRTSVWITRSGYSASSSSQKPLNLRLLSPIYPNRIL